MNIVEYCSWVDVNFWCCVSAPVGVVGLQERKGTEEDNDLMVRYIGIWLGGRV